MQARAEDETLSGTKSYTYSSTDAPKFLKRVEDRNFNALNEAYWLPSDSEEWNRLDKQHTAFTTALAGLYPAPEVVRAILTPETGVEKKILDLGCGSGVWANAMAKEFPHANVLGLDLAPTPVDESNIVPNCRFEICDINNGLAHLYGQFDVVHGRFLVSGIQNYRKTVDEAIRCLKPGGIILWIDCNYDTYRGYDFQYLPSRWEENPTTGLSPGAIGDEIRRMGASSGKNDFAGMMQVLSEGLWDHPSIDPETCKTSSLYIPLGPWAETKDVNQVQRLKYASTLVHHTFMGASQAGVLFLKKAGFSEEVLEKWMEWTTQALSDETAHISMMFRLMWGRRGEGSERQAPSLTIKSSEQEDAIPYPFYFVYDTKEVSMREGAKLRPNVEGNAVDPLQGYKNQDNV